MQASYRSRGQWRPRSRPESHPGTAPGTGMRGAAQACPCQCNAIAACSSVRGGGAPGSADGHRYCLAGRRAAQVYVGVSAGIGVPAVGVVPAAGGDGRIRLVGVHEDIPVRVLGAVGGSRRTPGGPAGGRRASGPADADAQRGGGLDPVPGDLALGRPQRDRAVAYGVTERILDGVFPVRYRARLNPEIACVVVAAQLKAVPGDLARRTHRAGRRRVQRLPT